MSNQSIAQLYLSSQKNRKVKDTWHCRCTQFQLNRMKYIKQGKSCRFDCKIGEAFLPSIGSLVAGGDGKSVGFFSASEDKKPKS